MNNPFFTSVKRCLLLFAVFWCGTAYAAEREGYTFPAEFEAHAAIWMSWNDQAYWAGRPTGENVLQIIKALAPFVQINLIVHDESEKRQVQKRLLTRNIPHDHIAYLVFPDNNRWLRDVGPIFLKNARGRLKIADFDYTLYGELRRTDPLAMHFEKMDRIIARHLGIPTVKTKLVSEGGGREFNGAGTMIAVEAVERQRNPEMTRPQIEAELMRILGQKKIVWLKKGPLEDDKSTLGPIYKKIYTATTTGGHIDEFCRFVDPSTLLLAEVTPEERDRDPISRISHERLEESYRILKAASDQNGQPFTIIRIPLADHIRATYVIKENDGGSFFFAGTAVGDTVQYVLSASYLNFLITNGVVLAPRYWKADRPASTRIKDQKALSILQTVFPNRRVVQLDVEDLNHGGGGIHCITQQQPAVP